MTSIIKKYHKAKHWQIFLIICVLPILLQLIIISIPAINNNPEVELKLVPILMIILGAGFLGWFWSVAIGLQKVIPAEIEMKIRKFKIFFFIPIIFIPLLFILMGYLPSTNGQSSEELSGWIIGGFVALAIPLHLTSMFGMLYSLYFAAKTFKTAELQKETRFADFAGELFMIYFFPIGIWVIQPKINKLTNNYANEK